MDKLLLGQRIHLARDLRNCSLQELANAIGLNKSTLSRYESGKIDTPKIPVVNAIGNALSVNPSWLLGKDEDMTYSPSSFGRILYTPCNLFTPLKKFRVSRNLSPEEVAFAIGISVKDYLAIESGYNTNCIVLARLAELFCTSTDVLLSFDGEFSIDDAISNAKSLSITEKHRKSDTKKLSYDECVLIEKFRRLDPSGQAMVINIIDSGLAAIPREETSPTARQA